MSFVTDPRTGLQLLELSHVWGMGAPSYPGQDDVMMSRAVKHSQHGVLAWKVKTDMHSGTHMIAPLHVKQRGEDLASLPLNHFFGNGVVLDLRHKTNFSVITAEDLKEAGEIREGDIVAINTGWHHKYSDGLEYFGEAPGLTKEAAEYLATKKPKIVAMDTPFIDVPLATCMGPHRGGPQMKRLAHEYHEATGKDAKEDFPTLYPAHRALADAGIPVIAQMGGDVDAITGKRATMAATPWKFYRGEACIVRFVAMVDPSGALKVDSGK